MTLANTQHFEKKVFSGIQPSGVLHLGNYLGAIRNWVGLQKDHDCLFCLVDLHAITVFQDPKELPNYTREMTAGLLASGLDAEHCVIFNQSQVTAHAELAWILNCVARLGWLNRMTQFKDKAGKNRERASVGLYAYPVLQAADILLYRATHVPVGEDQKQHLELARDIAQKFNGDFDTDFFPLPEPLIQGEATRVMSLRDGGNKMSKSDPSDASRINLTDDADAIARKIRKARTDSEPLAGSPDALEARPEARNLVGIFAALSDSSAAEICARYEGAQFSAIKQDLIDLAVEKLEPVTTEMNRLAKDPGYIDKVLADGAKKARAIATVNLGKVHDIVGFLRAQP